MKNSQRGFIVPLLIAIIAIFVVGGGVYEYSQNKNTQKSGVENQNTQNDIAKTNTSDNLGGRGVENTDPQIDQKTSDWQTYTDSKFGYSLKYPSGYSVRKYAKNSSGGYGLDNVNDQNIRIWIDSYLNNPSSKNSQYQQDLKEGKIIDFDLNVNDPEDNLVSAHYSSPARSDKGFKLVGSENIVINGNKVLKRNYVDTNIPQGSKEVNFSTYRFEKDSNYFTLLYDNGVSADLQKGKSIFDTFLNNFNFIPNISNNTTPKGGDNKIIPQVSGATKYTDSTYGFSMYYPSTWKLTPKGGNRDIGIINFDNIGPGNGESIDISVQEGNQVTTSDAKFGTINYFYDTRVGGWMMTGNAEGVNGQLTNTPQSATAEYYTASGLPVFLGTNRWKTTIVPLSITKFLVIHITGSGWTKVVDPLTKTVSAEGQNIDADKLKSAIKEEFISSLSQ